MVLFLVLRDGRENTYADRIRPLIELRPPLGFLITEYHEVDACLGVPLDVMGWPLTSDLPDQIADGPMDGG